MGESASGRVVEGTVRGHRREASSSTPSSMAARRPANNSSSEESVFRAKPISGESSSTQPRACHRRRQSRGNQPGRPGAIGEYDVGEVRTGPPLRIEWAVADLSCQLHAAGRRHVHQPAVSGGGGERNFLLGRGIAGQIVVNVPLDLPIVASQLGRFQRTHPGTVTQHAVRNGPLLPLKGRVAVGAMRAVDLLDLTHGRPGRFQWPANRRWSPEESFRDAAGIVSCRPGRPANASRRKPPALAIVPAAGDD